jgi:hypothetical protein
MLIPPSVYCDHQSFAFRQRGKHTLSHSLMPFDSAVSASIRLSVSSWSIDAYSSRTLASCLGFSRLLSIAVSRHERPVAISFWYSSTAAPEDDEMTSRRFSLAVWKHSSAAQIRRESGSASSARPDTDGDLFDTVADDRADSAGDMLTLGFGLRFGGGWMSA